MNTGTCHLIALVILAGICSPLAAQDRDGLPFDSTYYATPGLRNQQRPKALVISYDQIMRTPVSSTSDVLGNGRATLRKVEELKFKLKFPIEWKGRTKFFGGINYFYQEYNFKNPESLNYKFYDALENRHLNSLAVQLYVTHSFSRNRFLITRTGAEMNGDYQEDFVERSRFLRTSFSLLYGWRKTSDLSYGVGVYFNYDLGGPSVYPVVMYNRNFNKKFGIEAAFPKEVFLRWNATPRTFVYAGYDVSGSTFQLVFEDPALSPEQTMQLQRSNIRTKLVIEQEIHDFIWFGIEAGYHFTINMDLSNENFLFSLDDELIDTRFGPAPFFQVQLFLVPPRKLTKSALDKSRN